MKTTRLALSLLIKCVHNCFPQDEKEIVFARNGNDGKVKLTEEEKETFLSEGLPIPNRIPLTKVSELQERTSLDQNEINYKEVAYIYCSHLYPVAPHAFTLSLDTSVAEVLNNFNFKLQMFHLTKKVQKNVLLFPNRSLNTFFKVTSKYR